VIADAVIDAALRAAVSPKFRRAPASDDADTLWLRGAFLAQHSREGSPAPPKAVPGSVRAGHFVTLHLVGRVMDPVGCCQASALAR